MTEIIVKLLGLGDEGVLERVAPEAFDGPVHPALARAFLDEPGHSIAVAMDGDLVVGFASGVRYLHPDKPWALWINEIGVSPAWRRRGIGRAVLRRLLEEAAAAGCAEAWVGTEAGNATARAFYRALDGAEDLEGLVSFSFPLGPVLRNPCRMPEGLAGAEDPGIDSAGAKSFGDRTFR